MKPHGERILGYIGLLKGWKENRPPTPSDLKAWQEIWTMGPKDLDLIQEMARRAHRQGINFWDRGDREKALEVWQESWSLAPRDREALEEVAGRLGAWSEEHRETVQAYTRRLSYLRGRQPWQGLPPALRRYLAASGASILVLGLILALLPLLGPWLNPPSEPAAAREPSGSFRPLPAGLDQNIFGLVLKDAEAALNIYPEAVILTLGGKLETPSGLFTGMDFRVRLVDSGGNYLKETSFSPEEGRAAVWGEGRVFPFRKDFLFPREDLYENVRRLELEAGGLTPLTLPSDPEAARLAPELPDQDLRPRLTLRKSTWSQKFFTWSQTLTLEGGNSGQKPLKTLDADLVWKDARGQILLTKPLDLHHPGFPALKAGENFFYSLTAEFPSEVFDFETEGFPQLEARWNRVE